MMVFLPAKGHAWTGSFTGSLTDGLSIGFSSEDFGTLVTGLETRFLLPD